LIARKLPFVSFGKGLPAIAAPKILSGSNQSIATRSDFPVSGA